MSNFRTFVTRGLDGYDLWGTYATEELAEKTKRELQKINYLVKIKMTEDLHHNLVWNVYYR